MDIRDRLIHYQTRTGILQVKIMTQLDYKL
nr:MAG TPA: hypothetical protein [Crassvirales sp.]